MTIGVIPGRAEGASPEAIFNSMDSGLAGCARAPE